MVLNTFYDMLDELETMSSHIDIEEHLVYILKQVKNAEKFFRLTFNDTVYGLAEQSFYNAFDIENKFKYEHVSDWLEEMKSYEPMNRKPYTIHDLEKFAFEISQLSGNSLLIKISNFFRQIENQKAKWFCRALLHDLRCGVQVKTINRAFKRVGLKPIKKFSLQLCAKNLDLYDPDNKQLKKITFPCSMELKEDGIRVQATIWTDESGTHCNLKSRRGKDRTDLHPEIVDALLDIFVGENVILDGEVTARDFNSLSRKDDKSIRQYVIYDLLNDENLPYRNRWDNLVNLLSSKGLLTLGNDAKQNNVVTEYNDNKFNNINLLNNSSAEHIRIVEHYTANNTKDLQAYYEDINRRGEEGIIIKLEDRPYERNSRKNMFKVKKVFDADLEIIGFNYGEGKRAGKVGSLQLIDKSRTVRVDVGSGLSDEDVERFTKQVDEWIDDTPIQFVGKIAEIQYNELSQNKEGNISIRFPRFIKIRNDLEEPEDLSKCQLRKI